MLSVNHSGVTLRSENVYTYTSTFVAAQKKIRMQIISHETDVENHKNTT
jgi:hypothetical protein